MPQTSKNNVAFKRALKEALTETLHEQRALLHEVFAEVIEDVVLSEAVRKGRKTQRATRAEVFRILKGKP